jgi:hypothetical protein
MIHLALINYVPSRQLAGEKASAFSGKKGRIMRNGMELSETVQNKMIKKGMTKL